MTVLRKYVLRSDVIVESAREFIGELPREPLYEVVIREFKDKRSLDQNAFYWDQVVTPAADHFGYTPAEMHEEFLCAIFGTKTISFNGRTREVPRERSSSQNKQRFSWYIDRCRQLAIQNGAPLQ